MSKPTSYFVSLTNFEEAFGFLPCSCSKKFRTASDCFYTVRYETKSYDTVIKRIDVTCGVCNIDRTFDIESMNIDGNDLPF